MPQQAVAYELINIMNKRLQAAQILQAIFDNKISLDQALLQAEQKNSEIFKTESSWIKACCYGVCRHYAELQFYLQQLMAKPMRQKDQEVEFLLLVGLYQLIYMNAPVYAVLNETVSALSKRYQWARGLINGLLRNFIREQNTLKKLLTKKPLAYYNQPQWLYDHIIKTWPEHALAIFNRQQQHPALVLRVNQLQGSRQDYLNHCEKAGVIALAHLYAENAVILDPPLPTEKIPGFYAGKVSVQDAGAQWAVPLLDLKSGMRILDACAAPGGKTAHILESPVVLKELIAIDQGSKRCQLINDNLKRLKLLADNVKVSTNDLTELKWWDGNYFERICLDAPCSATGVIQRHPDIRWLRTLEQVKNATILQLKLLKILWTTLAPGGKLLYITCSILPEENHELIATFLATEKTAQALPISLANGFSQTYGFQFLPIQQELNTYSDGFYYCLLEKEVK